MLEDCGEERLMALLLPMAIDWPLKRRATRVMAATGPDTVLVEEGAVLVGEVRPDSWSERRVCRLKFSRISTQLDWRSLVGRSACIARLTVVFVWLRNARHKLLNVTRSSLSPGSDFPEEASIQRFVNVANSRAWSIRYGREAKPSFEVWGSRENMVMGVVYEGGMRDTLASVGIRHIASMYDLNSDL